MNATGDNFAKEIDLQKSAVQSVHTQDQLAGEKFVSQ